MLKIKYLGAVFCSVALAATALAGQSDADCQASWERADKDRNGIVSGPEVTPYLIALMKRKDVFYEHARDGKLTHDEFVKACKEGAFENVNLEVWDSRRDRRAE